MERYKDSPEFIKKFLEMNGPALGACCEQYARFHFQKLSTRKPGQTGYDHILNHKEREWFIEQKSSTLWATNDF